MPTHGLTVASYKYAYALPFFSLNPSLFYMLFSCNLEIAALKMGKKLINHAFTWSIAHAIIFNLHLNPFCLFTPTVGTIPLRQLVYRVLDLPPSMRPLVCDFGQLTTQTEESYTHQIVLDHVRTPVCKWWDAIMMPPHVHHDVQCHLLCRSCVII